MEKRKNILICPLNWGLGHATRCVPIINEFILQGANVIIAADKRPLAFLKMEFPDLQFIKFPAYEITYHKKGSFALRMFMILPKLVKGIREEHKILNELIDKYALDIVISDNRYGLWNKKVKRIFITHQIYIKSPLKLKFFDWVLFNINKLFIRNYNECWVPDIEGNMNLSGELSHKNKLPIETCFIGPLTRFKSFDNKLVTEEFDLLVLLSGPEPQRSIFEELVLKELKNSVLNVVIVRGIPDEKLQTDFQRQNIKVYSHLPTDKLQDLIMKSKLILCRSGYSTIMDLAESGKKAILVPTPGQTEQEYLANYYLSKKYYYSVSQKEFNLDEAIIKSKDYTGVKLENSYLKLRERINSLLKE